MVPHFLYIKSDYFAYSGKGGLDETYNSFNDAKKKIKGKGHTSWPHRRVAKKYNEADKTAASATIPAYKYLDTDSMTNRIRGEPRRLAISDLASS